VHSVRGGWTISSRPAHPPGLVPPRVARTFVAMTLRG
jgi:hypothetical protein